MMDPIVRPLYDFLLSREREKKALLAFSGSVSSGRDEKKRVLLLAFSGGPDSLALLHMLLECEKACSLDFALAHVDHGWREESEKEAQEIAAMAARLNIPLHLHKLQAKGVKNGDGENMEAFARKERISFFKELAKEHGYEAVLFAHHADDLAETVLKRLFEGASLVNVAGMRPISIVDGLVIWRPLLSLRKSELVAWLDAKGLRGFFDSTNEDERFLRARMRKSLFPHLTKLFGKEIAPSLCHLASEADEIKGYFEERIGRHVDLFVPGPFGFFWDFDSGALSSLIEAKYFIRGCCRKAGVEITRERVALAAEALAGGAANKSFPLRGHSLYVDRFRLFIVRSFDHADLTASSPCSLMMGNSCFGKWHVAVKLVAGDELANLKKQRPQGWQDLWKGSTFVLLPAGAYELAMSQGSKGQSKAWQQMGVPAFLRSLVPTLYCQGKMCHEFLSGKMLCKEDVGTSALLVRLDFANVTLARI